MNMRNGALALGMVLGVAGLVRADAAKQSISVALLSETSLNGTALPAGQYTIAWTEENQEADVTLKSGGKVVVQAKAKLVEEKDSPDSNVIVSRKDSKGQLALAEIRLKGKKTALVLAAS